MKAKRFLSFFLAFATALTVFCIVPTVQTRADGYTKLNAVKYGILNRYSQTDREKDSDGEYIVGGIDLNRDASSIQTFSSMQTDGFTDKTNIPYVAFRVSAPADGNYGIKVKYNMGLGDGGSFSGDGYFMAIDVNNLHFYKSPYVKAAGSYEDSYTVNLKAGINIIRVLTAFGETYSMNPWCNIHALYIESSLAGEEVGETLRIGTGNSAKINKFTANTSSGTLGGVDPYTMRDYGYNYDNLKVGDLARVPYFSYTVDVAESGYYDMSLEFYTGVIGATGYFIAFVDSTKYKVNFIDTKAWYSVNNMTLYLPEGTHTITVTSAIGHSAEFYRTWCDFSAFIFAGGGIKLSETQKEPTEIYDPTRLEAETYAELNGYVEIQDGGSAGKCVGGANWDYGKAQTYESLSDYFDKSNMLYATFRVSAPSDGNYLIKPGYFWSGGADTSHFMTVLVNDHNTCKVQFSRQGSSLYNSASVSVKLKKGSNIIRLIPFTAGNNNGNGWINLDYLDIDDRLTGLNSKDYIRAEAEKAEYYENMQIIFDGQLGNSNIQQMKKSEFKADGITKSMLPETAYFAITVNAPSDGWYDMTVLCNPEKKYTSEPDYLGVIVDNRSAAYGLRRDTANGNVPTGELYSVNKVDLTTYLTSGDHLLVITAPCPKADGSGNYLRINFDAVLLYGGLKLGDTQQDPRPQLAVYYEAEDAFMHNYQRCFNENESWHGYDSAYIGSANYNTVMYASDMTEYLDQRVGYIAFRVKAPEDGNYNMQLRFKFGCESAEAYDDYVKEYGRPYAVLTVNGRQYRIEHPTNNGWISPSALFSVELKKGINIIYAFAMAKDIADKLGGAYIDYDYLLMEKGLEQIDSDLYFLGDANGDGTVDIKDILRTKKFIADPKNVKCDELSANMNEDAAYRIDASDLAIMKRLITAPSDSGMNKYAWLRINGGNENSGITALRSMPYNESWLVDVSDAVSVRYADDISDGNYTINVSDTRRQTFEGFGAAMTETSGYNLSFMEKEQRAVLFNDLFGSDNGDALALHFLRQPFGASDFSVGEPYTYDDMPQGQTDTSLNNFSISRDEKYIIPYVKEAQSINKNIEFVAGIWTAPLWMKTRYEWNTASGNAMLDSKYYGVYSDYIIKALRAYKDRGINIKYLSAQNEPDGNHNIPATWYDKYAMESFVGGSLYGKLQQSGLSTKLIAYDFNWFDTNEDNITRIKGYISGPNNGLSGKYHAVAFHPYMFNADVQSVIHNAYPNMPIYVTEAAGNTSRDNYFNSSNRTVASLRNYAAMYLYWNIMLDQNCGPYLENMGGGGIGLLEYNNKTGKVSKLSDYYALAHYSKFIKPGAVIVDTTATQDIQYIAAGSNSYKNYVGLTNVAAVNTDGTYSLVLNNNFARNVRVKILIGNGLAIQYCMPAKSTVSLNWNPANVSEYAVK